MDEIEKLKKLLHHWQEHNDEHAEVYREWSEKTANLGNRELSEILLQLYNEAKKMNKLFEDAITKIH